MLQIKESLFTMTIPNVYIIKSDNVDEIVNELKLYRHKCQFSIVESNSAKDLLAQIGILEEDKKIFQDLNKRHSQIITENYNKAVENIRYNKKIEQRMAIKKYIDSILMDDTRQLYDDQIKALCNEFYFEFIII